MKTLQLKNVSIPLNSHILNSYKIPARTELIIPLHVLNPEIKEGILPQVNSIPGVYLSKALVKVLPNNICLAKLANTTNQEYTYAVTSLKLLPLDKEAQILTYNNDSFPNSTEFTISKRIELLNENIRVQHLNAEEAKSLLQI